MAHKRNLLPKQAFDIMQENDKVLFVDVRCSAERKFVGFPKGSVLIPWQEEPKWQVNEDLFIDSVKDELADRKNIFDAEIILICRSGYRSNDALKCLEKSGFNKVSHVASGFEGDLDEHNQRGNLNGWRKDEMPWSQS